MERLEGTVIAAAEELAAFYARLECEGRVHHRLRKRIGFTLAMDDGTRVRVRGRAPRLGPTTEHGGTTAELRETPLGSTFDDLDLPPDVECELRAVGVRAGDRVVVEGLVSRAKISEGYRGPKKLAVESIDAIAIGVGDRAHAFLDDEVERRRRAALMEELGTLRKLGPALRRPLIAMAVGAFLVVAGLVLDLLDVPLQTVRYLAVGLGLQLVVGGLGLTRLALGWGGRQDPVTAKSTLLTVSVICSVVMAVVALNVAGGAASHAQFGMGAVPLTGSVAFMLTAKRPGKRARDAYRWAHRLTLGLLIGATLLGAFFSWRTIAQDHYGWTARVVESDRADIAVGDECAVSIGYAPRGFASGSAQCETDLRCNDIWLYGEYQGFVPCERATDGFHGEDPRASDGDGVVELRGTSGSSGGVVFEGPPLH